jgi:hypothetical protein
VFHRLDLGFIRLAVGIFLFSMLRTPSVRRLNIVSHQFKTSIIASSYNMFTKFV